jgi:hypothetical protein
MSGRVGETSEQGDSSTRDRLEKQDGSVQFG